MTELLTSRVRDLIARADSLEEAGDLKGAIVEISRAIELDPESPVLRYQRGLLFLSSEEWQSAIQDFDVALESQPGAQNTMFRRAIARSISEDLDGALRDLEETGRRLFEQAVSRKKLAADAYFKIGLIHQRRGELERALTAYESAERAIDGGYVDASEEIAEIREKLDSQK